jgi:hypothetical protein
MLAREVAQDVSGDLLLLFFPYTCRKMSYRLSDYLIDQLILLAV